MHFNGRFILNLAQFAGKLGAKEEEILQLSGLSSEELCREDCRLGPEIYNGVTSKCVELTGDELFGLHAGENLNLAAAGLIFQISQTSSTVEEALKYCCEFANLGCSALPTELHRDGGRYKLTLTPDPLWARLSEEAVVHTVLGYLAFTVREFQSLIGTEKWPEEIWMACDQIGDPNELRRVVGCEVKFGREEFAIFFRKEDVERSVVTSDYNLLGVLIRHAEQKIIQLKAEEGFGDVVKRSVIQLVKPDFPTIEQVAGHLNMSVRTFQRRLSEDGYSYKGLIDNLRKEFAFDYLRNQELSISEVAYLLSYSDASAFIRTFKRWTGKTPLDWRRELAA